MDALYQLSYDGKFHFTRRDCPAVGRGPARRRETDDLILTMAEVEC